jgi:tetratricopeptide (TPR) repeat protein
VSLFGCITQVCQEESRALYAERRYDEALYSLDHIQAGLQGSSSYAFDRGLVLYALGRFEEALVEFDRVLAEYPESVRAAAQRSHTLMRLGRLPEARAQWQKILEFKRIDVEHKRLRSRSYVQGNLALIRLTEGDLAGGKRALEEALQTDGRNDLAQTLRNKVLPELEAGRVSPEALPTLIAAFEDLELGRPNSALRQMRTVLSSYPDFKLGYHIVADTQRRYGAYEECETTMRMAALRFKNDINLQAERIRCALLRHGVHSNAAMPSIEELRDLARKDPNDPLVREIMLLLEQ